MRHEVGTEVQAAKFGDSFHGLPANYWETLNERLKKASNFFDNTIIGINLTAESGENFKASAVDLETITLLTQKPIEYFSSVVDELEVAGQNPLKLLDWSYITIVAIAASTAVARLENLAAVITDPSLHESDKVDRIIARRAEATLLERLEAMIAAIAESFEEHIQSLEAVIDRFIRIHGKLKSKLYWKILKEKVRSVGLWVIKNIHKILDTIHSAITGTKLADSAFGASASKVYSAILGVMSKATGVYASVIGLATYGAKSVSDPANREAVVDAVNELNKYVKSSIHSDSIGGISGMSTPRYAVNVAVSKGHRRLKGLALKQFKSSETGKMLYLLGQKCKLTAFNAEMFEVALTDCVRMASASSFKFSEIEKHYDRVIADKRAKAKTRRVYYVDTREDKVYVFVQVNSADDKTNATKLNDAFERKAGEIIRAMIDYHANQFIHKGEDNGKDA